ncbi:MAG: hypothetical protein MST00_03480 [Tenericutes bacterium]|nr:hypothetical protein [Mycoplasmatota bacterium]
MNKIELPALHKDMYYFGYGIDIEKPIEMANIIIELQQENKILKENAENNDKVVDKVNWENQLLKKENEQLKDNWNKLKEYIKETKLKEFEKDYGKRYAKTFTQSEIVVCNMIMDKMLELEKGSDK